MNRPPHIRAALSSGGLAIAKHLRVGSVLLTSEIGPTLAEDIAWSLRSRGLTLVQSDAGWTVYRSVHGLAT